MVLHHEADELAGTFVGSRFFGVRTGTPEMQHLARKWFNLVLLHDRYRGSALHASRLPAVKHALDVVRSRMDAL